jgi:hypothetical protein
VHEKRPPQVRPQADDTETSISSVNELSIVSETSSASSGATSSTSSVAEAEYVDGEGFEDPDEDEISKMELVRWQ